MVNYYAQRKSIKNGQPVAVSNRYGTRQEMLRQYFLYCANAATNQDENEFDSIEFGTIENGVLKVERFTQPVPEPEQEEEPEGVSDEQPREEE